MVLIETGKPALLLPCTCAASEFDRTILIDGKDAPALACAVTAALSLLRHTKSVRVAAWVEADSAADSQSLLSSAS